ncbi:BTAD domain-containing putative transcriptional regulator [Dactylosporangium darangshiense]|uniref:BTAD domain-containing putative transcriptional regulator n=1 Tax=Dactylosporangium darangshiense TaxID=579108 RepID=A0ABP8D8X4_9ACTN
MQVRLLGPVDVAIGGGAVEVSGLRRKAVLAALAVAHGEVVSTDRLIDVVWGADPPATALNTLQRHVSHLRQVLGDRDAIRARPPGYVLDLGGADPTDAAQAERLIAEAERAADPAGRAGLLRAALALWRGRSLDDLAGLAGLDAEAERLDNLWIGAQTALVDARLLLGEHAQVLPDLERLARDHRLDERVHGQLMLAQYRSGRPADALATYRRLRRALAADLGLDPGQALRDLEAAVLRQDPALDLAAPRPAAAVPAQIPLAVRGFTGRDAELARLDALLDPAALVVCAVTGPPGVGKTSLAVHWAHGAARQFPDGQLYVNLRDQEPADALRGFLGALGVAADALPPDPQALATLYRSILAGRRVLLILDNARDAEQVRPLLPGTAGCLVLVTARQQLTPLVAAEGAHPFALDLLTGGEARDLLARRLGAERVAAEPGAVEEIIARCARLPLALAIAAAHAATRPGSPLSVQAAQLRDAAGGLDALDGGDPATDVRTVFSWSYRALDDAAARLFRLLGLHPGPDLTAPGAASLAGLPLPRARMLLRRLVEANLLTEHAPGRYAFHDLLRSYAAERALATDAADERREAAHRVLDHHLHTAHAAALLIDPARRPVEPAPPRPGVTIPRLDTPDRALDWFAANHRVLTAAVQRATDDGFDAHAWRLAWTLTTYFDWQGRFDDLVATQLAALDALRRLDEVPGRAHVHRDLGRTLARLGRHEEAEAHLRQALELYERLGDQVGMGRVHHSVGWMLMQQGRHREALAQAERAVERFRAAGDLLWHARTLGAAGWLHAQLGDHAHSLEVCLEALALQQKVGDRHAEAGNWDSIAFAHHRLGDFEAARHGYEEAIRLFDELGDRASLGEVLVHLGDTRAASGDPGAARADWRRALELLEGLGHPAAAEARERLSAR